MLLLFVSSSSLRLVILFVQSRIDKDIFDCSLDVKKLLFNSTSSSDTGAPPVDHKGMRLPKIDVPKFDGNIIGWRMFWEQFQVSIHSRTNLSNSEKLVYLRHLLKDASAKNVIEGLSRSGDCLKKPWKV